jgi:hypothetical protein
VPGERHDPAEGAGAGEPREQGRSAEEDRRSRPDIRAARTETRLRRWALLLLVLVPVVYFLYQHFS